VVEYVAELSLSGGFLVQSGVLNLNLVIRFNWIDSNGKLIDKNQHSESVTKNLGTDYPILPYNIKKIRGYGAQLENSLLPLVISKEIRESKILK